MRTISIFLAAALPALLAVGAQASPDYPGTAQDHLTLERAPACTICHATTAGGAGTVVKPMGAALLDLGLGGGSDTAGLTAALDDLEAAGTDSDGDGTGDVDELRAGTDPNVDEGTGGGEPPPEAVRYGVGCASTTAQGSGLFAIFALVLGACARVNRRR